MQHYSSMRQVMLKTQCIMRASELGIWGYSLTLLWRGHKLGKHSRQMRQAECVAFGAGATWQGRIRKMRPSSLQKAILTLRDWRVGHALERVHGHRVQPGRGGCGTQSPRHGCRDHSKVAFMSRDPRVHYGHSHTGYIV